MAVEVSSITDLKNALNDKTPVIKVIDSYLATKVTKFKKIPNLSIEVIVKAMMGMGDDVLVLMPMLGINRYLLLALYNDYEMQIDNEKSKTISGSVKTKSIILKKQVRSFK